MGAGPQWLPERWSPASPESFDARVTWVVDGDTVVVELPGGQEERICLGGIDAPERDQPWGEAATRELRRQVAGQTVAVRLSKRDRYERIVGVILLDGEDQILHIVDRDMAWHYKRCQNEQRVGDRRQNAAAEDAAREASRGLWSDPEPMPPWEWRSR
jgi:endonuclease YncB( thermonuclease family)